MYYFIYLIFKRIELSVIVSVFFAIHPMHVESVVWITELKDVLYAFFFILSLICYVKYINSKKYQVSSIKYQDKKRTTYYLLTFIFFILSVLSQSAAVTLPIILLLLDYQIIRLSDYKKNLKILRLIIEKLPFFIFALVFGLIQ